MLFNMVDKVCVGSLSTRNVALFRAAIPEAARAASLTEVIRLFLLTRLRLPELYRGGADAVQIPELQEVSRLGRLRGVTPRMVRAAHQHNMAVHVWTVNDIAGMKRLIKMGVDGLMTDYPDLLLKLLARKPRKTSKSVVGSRWAGAVDQAYQGGACFLCDPWWRD